MLQCLNYEDKNRTSFQKPVMHSEVKLVKLNYMTIIGRVLIKVSRYFTSMGGEKLGSS